jgi:hypothetical protein
VAVTKNLWVGDDPEGLFCETPDAAAYMLELPNPPRVVVPSLDAARETLQQLGMDETNQSLLIRYAARRWESGYPD